MVQQTIAEYGTPAPASDVGGTVSSIEQARQVRYRRDVPGDVIRVLLVGGHGLIRAGLRRLLDDDRGIVVVGEAAGDDDAARMVSAMRPDVVLLDAGYWETDPAATMRAVAGRAAVLLLTPSEAEDRVLDALRAGAIGVVGKDSRPAQLASAVRTVAAGGAPLPPSTTRRLIAELAATSCPTAG